MSVAALVLLAIEAWRSQEQIVPPDSPPVASEPPPAELLDRMFSLLVDDPNVMRPETRAAVEAVATLTVSSGMVTAETSFAQGLLSYGARDLAGAEASYRRAIGQAPDWSWPYVGLGIVLSEEGRVAEAERAFLKASELDPEWSRPHNDLSILLRSQGRLHEAETHARRAIALDPENAAIYNNFGNLLVTAGDYDGAETAYLRSIELNPARPAPHYNLACLYAIETRVDDALASLGEAIRLNPGFAQTAREDQDLAALREEPRFIALTQGTESGETR